MNRLLNGKRVKIVVLLRHRLCTVTLYQDTLIKYHKINLILIIIICSINILVFGRMKVNMLFQMFVNILKI